MYLHLTECERHHSVDTEIIRQLIMILPKMACNHAIMRYYLAGITAKS